MVDKDTFEAILDSKLPDGTQINTSDRRSFGTDLTFSAPKSVSVMALVAGDKRLLKAEMNAVDKTMGWTEKQFAEARDYSRVRKGEPIGTERLIYARFQHDTSRRLDPQSHVHVVVAPITQTKDGQHKALYNRELWINNTQIGAAYHANLRNEVEKLGYQTQITGKHGQFEIKGVPEQVLKSFSQRRTEILAKSKELNVTSHKAQDRITVNSRDRKLGVGDRDALGQSWKDRANELGFDGKALVEQAELNAAKRDEPGPIGQRVAAAMASAKATVQQFLRPADPLVTNGLDRMLLSPTDQRAELAVASSLRILGQREAAFSIGDLRRTALNLGLAGVTVEKVDDRLVALAKGGELIPGATHRRDGRVDLYTTREHLLQERRLLREIDAGRGASKAIVEAVEIEGRVSAAAIQPLSGEQLGAARLALTTTDRIAVIQGVAGAGKTTMIDAIARVAEQQGHKVEGLAFANRMVAMLRDEAKIETGTVSRFVNDHIAGALEGEGPQYDASREQLAGSILVLDEASLVATEPMSNLVKIANAMGVHRLILMGDRQQLQPIDAGKAFTLIQENKPALAQLEVSQRQRTKDMKQVATLTRNGAFKEAFDVLGSRVEAAGKDVNHIAVAADKWLSLSDEKRETTALYASGRAARQELNERVQGGLRGEGAIGGRTMTVTALANVTPTREELRYPASYKPGDVLYVAVQHSGVGLNKGRYGIVRRSDDGNIIVRTEDGREYSMNPMSLDPASKRDEIQLLEKQQIDLHENEKIRWTANDKDRGLLNSDEAKVLQITDEGVKLKTATGAVLQLPKDDPMLERLNLSYAVNMHQAQGMTSNEAIGVMSAKEQFLSNQRLTHVMATRVRDDLTIVTDDKDRLLSAIARNPGDKKGALEAIQRPLETKLDKHFEATDIPRAHEKISASDLARSLRYTQAPDPAIDRGAEREIERNR